LGNIGEIKRIIVNGVDANAKEKALFLALKNGHMCVAEMLNANR